MYDVTGYHSECFLQWSGLDARGVVDCTVTVGFFVSWSKELKRREISMAFLSSVQPRYNELKETGGSIRYIGVFIISDWCILLYRFL
jgi:hypothetical protein